MTITVKVQLIGWTTSCHAGQHWYNSMQSWCTLHNQI